MKIIPRNNDIGLLSRYANFDINSPDHPLIDIIKYREDFGFGPEAGQKYTQCIKKYKKVILAKWDKIFEKSNLPIEFENAIKHLQATQLDGLRKFTFSKFIKLSEGGYISKQQQNKILIRAEINKDKVIEFYEAFGYIRHPSTRVPENPFNWIEVLFGEGEDYIYVIYKWARANFDYQRYSNVYFHKKQ